VKEYFQQLIDEKIEEIKTKEKQKIGECSSEIKKLGNIGVVSLKFSLNFEIIFFRILFKLKINGVELI